MILITIVIGFVYMAMFAYGIAVFVEISEIRQAEESQRAQERITREKRETDEWIKSLNITDFEAQRKYIEEFFPQNLRE